MFIRFIKNAAQELKFLIYRKTKLSPTVQVKSEWHGNNYGGFYIYPTFLNEKSVVYSFGIGEDISFDVSIINHYNCKVYAFDPTPRSIDWINNQILSPKFTFFPYGLDKQTGIVNFNLPRNKEYVSGSILKHANVDEYRAVPVQVKSFADLIIELGHQQIDILKMDIEGSEYEVMDSILNSGVEIIQILVEIHERFFPDGVSKTKNLFSCLNQHGYEAFAVSRTMNEISFLKSSYLPSKLTNKIK